MAGGKMPVLNLPGVIGGSGGLKVSGDTGSATASGKNVMGNTVGTSAAGASGDPALLVRFV